MEVGIAGRASVCEVAGRGFEPSSYPTTRAPGQGTSLHTAPSVDRDVNGGPVGRIRFRY